MSYTPIPEGTLNWDDPLNAALTDQDNRITDNTTVNNQQNISIAANTAGLGRVRGATAQPEDFGLLAWTYDPATVGAGVVPATGSIIMVKMWFEVGTVTSLGVFVNVAGAGLVANQSFMGLYDQAGTLLGQTADLSVTFTSVGYKQNALVTPVAISTAGFYYVALVCNGATPVGITRGSNVTTSATYVNLNTTAANHRFATAGTGTVLPASITMSSRTITSQSYWVTAA